MNFLQAYEGGFQTEDAACLTVSTEYPEACGECNIDACDGKSKLGSAALSSEKVSLGLAIFSLGLSIYALP